jgi:hypothetical protein
MKPLRGARLSFTFKDGTSGSVNLQAALAAHLIPVMLQAGIDQGLVRGAARSMAAEFPDIAMGEALMVVDRAKSSRPAAALILIEEHRSRGHGYRQRAALRLGVSVASLVPVIANMRAAGALGAPVPDALAARIERVLTAAGVLPGPALVRVLAGRLAMFDVVAGESRVAQEVGRRAALSRAKAGGRVERLGLASTVMDLHAKGADAHDIAAALTDAGVFMTQDQVGHAIRRAAGKV